LRTCLELVPEVLIVDLVVILHFRRFDDRTQEAGAAIGRGLLEIGEATLYIGAEEFRGPGGGAEVLESGVDVVGQVAFGLAEVLDLGDFAIDPGLEDRIENHVGVGVRSDGADFDARDRWPRP